MAANSNEACSCVLFLTLVQLSTNFVVSHFCDGGGQFRFPRGPAVARERERCSRQMVEVGVAVCNSHESTLTSAVSDRTEPEMS
jgi:hypothetical protein